MEVIVSDIDNTLVCTKARWEACLAETNGKMNSQFWGLFQSDKYTNLDTPIWAALYVLYNTYKGSGLPVVLLTGRSDDMVQGNNFVRNLLNSLDIKIYDEIYRVFRTDKVAEFKLKAVEEAGYYPVYLFEDDEENIKAFKEKYEDCIVYQVIDCKNIVEVL